MSNVLVVFQSNTEPIEQMALAVAVGAVEAGGSIRLRRLAAPGAPEVGHQSYGKIKAGDLEWADTIVVGLERAKPVPDELDPLLGLLQAGNFARKRGWTFGTDPLTGPTEAQVLVEAALRRAGLLMEVPDGLSGSVEGMKALGRLSAETTG